VLIGSALPLRYDSNLIRTTLREDQFVLDEMDYLEGLRTQSKTKKEMQFPHPPLHPFWHKHYSAPRHIHENIGIRWGITGSRNKVLHAMLKELCMMRGNGNWQDILTHQIVFGGFVDRSRRGLTGDWIIYAKHERQLYYLDLAGHEESNASEQLYQKLRAGSSAEFPFLFEQRSTSSMTLGRA
jgi:hypothetical protein